MKLMHWIRWILDSAPYGLFPTDGGYQVIYQDGMRTVRMPYRIACSYACIGRGVVVKFGKDEILWRPLNANR